MNCKMKGNKEKVKIIINILPERTEIETNIPITAKSNEIIKRLLHQGIIPKRENPYPYDLVVMGSGRIMGSEETLFEVNVQDGDVIICQPRILAGGSHNGNMIYYLPSILTIGESETCSIRIAQSKLKEYILKEGFAEDDEINIIEISDVMRVKLEENSLKEHIIIKSFNYEEQVITEYSYSEWNFDLIPVRLGFTSLILRISIVLNIEGLGEKTKDVFFLNEEIEVSKDYRQSFGSSFVDFSTFSDWTDEIKNELYQFITQNKTGKALSTLANLFQKNNDIFNSIILLHSQWNEGRNQNRLNLISMNEWLSLQTKINYSILEIISDIENKLKPQKNHIKSINNLIASSSNLIGAKN